MEAVDHTGKRFGRLIALRYIQPGHGKKGRWECACGCGAVCSVVTGDLVSGHTASCGCLNRHVRTKHGMSTDPLYQIWVGIRSRILNETHSFYKYYGGRGLGIEPEWVDEATGFPSFKAWVDANLGPRPTKKHSLDRVNNDLGYLKGNLKYSTVVEQANNMRSNVPLTFNGETMNMSQWCARLGLHQSTVYMRIHRCGWSVERALSTAARAHRTKKHP